MDRYKTRVIFRKFPDGDVIALMPGSPGDMSPNTCQSYQHFGQHGAASVDLIRDLPKASPDEYADLLAELGRIGYNVKIAHRESYMDRKARIAAL